MAFSNLWKKQLFTVEGDHKLIGIMDTIWLLVSRINVFIFLLILIISIVVAIIAFVRREPFKMPLIKGVSINIRK